MISDTFLRYIERLCDDGIGLNECELALAVPMILRELLLLRQIVKEAEELVVALPNSEFARYRIQLENLEREIRRFHNEC
jgi:hypothetical protein